MELKPIKYKRAYEKLIAEKISNWIWDTFYKGCFEILKSETVYNDADVIRAALEQGLIYYQEGAFYSKTGRFKNAIAKELEALGARYSKYRKAYMLDKSKLPTEILWAIDTFKAKTAEKVALIQAYLTSQLGNISEEVKKLVFNTAVEEIMLDLQERVYKNAAEKKIELITPKLTDFRANEIAKNYTNNLNFWVKNWTEAEDFNNVTIPKMREVIGQMAIDGKSIKDIEAYLLQSFTKSVKHAKFLARNETAIATTSYLEAKYKEEGITEFKWHTNLDGRERPLHKELHNQVFRFDNPPIIDERTGEKGLPGETYNCRCAMSPVINKEFWENRRKLYKAQNSFLNTLKGFINGKIQSYNK